MDQKHMNEREIELLADHIVVNALNKIREYYGSDGRVSNYFLKELDEDTKRIIMMHLYQQD